MEDITSSEILLIRIALLRSVVVAKDAEIAVLKRRIAQQGEGIELLSRRVNEAEGRRGDK